MYGFFSILLSNDNSLTLLCNFFPVNEILIICEVLHSTTMFCFYKSHKSKRAINHSILSLFRQRSVRSNIWLSKSNYIEDASCFLRLLVTSQQVFNLFCILRILATCIFLLLFSTKRDKLHNICRLLDTFIEYQINILRNILLNRKKIFHVWIALQGEKGVKDQLALDIGRYNCSPNIFRTLF